MFCEKCGSRLDEITGVCPNCNPVAGGQQFSGNSFNTQYQQPTQEIKTTGILVWSIIELLCVSPLFGLIAIILYFVQLRPAVQSGDANAVLKAKKPIKIILWIGGILGIIVVIGMIVAMGVAVVLPMVNTASNVRELNRDALDSIDNLRSTLEKNSSYVEEYDYDYGRYYDYDF